MNEPVDSSLGQIARLYEESMRAHGPLAPGVGWRDAQSHSLRFRKLLTVVEGDLRPLTVNDLGTGYGALLEYLREHEFPVSSFWGYDISDEILRIARERNPSGSFHLGSRLEKRASYSFASGIFNVRLGADDGSWLTHIEATLDNLDEQSDRGFAFNLLSTYVDYREDHLYYGDPLYFFDRCKTRYSPDVSLLHDYPLYEWTITVKKR